MRFTYKDRLVILSAAIRQPLVRFLFHVEDTDVDLQE